MFRKKYGIIGLAVLLVFGLGWVAFANERPYIGVRLDPSGLNPLLSKHLRLEPGQGLLIRNVQVESPADQAGLEKDDIIIGCDGSAVGDYDVFVEKIMQAGVGETITLEVIHLGQRKQVDVTLEALEPDGQWKYPVGPDTVESWRPGRVFRFSPDEDQWQSIPFDELPNGDSIIKKFFKQQSIYYHTDSQGNSYTVIIDGDPDSKNATITVRAGEQEYTATPDTIEDLPEKYRQAARDSLKSAQAGATTFPDFDDESLPGLPGFNLPHRSDRGWSEPFGRPFGFGPNSGDPFEQMQRQMEEMLRRMREMERRHEDLYDRLPESLNEGLTDEAERL